MNVSGQKTLTNTINRDASDVCTIARDLFSIFYVARCTNLTDELILPSVRKNKEKNWPSAYIKSGLLRSHTVYGQTILDV